jgi:hypothetical protein
MGRATGIRLLATLAGIGWGVTVGAPAAMAQRHGAELGNNLFIVTNLAKSTTYKTEMLSGPDRTVNLWDGERVMGSIVHDSGLAEYVEAMQRAIAACDERELIRLKLSALNFLEVVAQSSPEVAARAAQYVNAVGMTCDGQTYAARSERARETFTRTFGPIIRRMDEAAKAREQKTGEQDAGGRKASEKKSSRKESTKQSKTVRGKPQVKKVVTVTGGESSKVGRKEVPTGISTPPPPPGGHDVTKLKPLPQTGANATIRGVEADKKKRAAAQALVEEARLEAIGRLQHDASVLLTELQQVKRPCLSPAQRERILARAREHLLILMSPGESSPGMKQLRQAIDAETARIGAIPDCPSSAFDLGVNGGFGQIQRPDFDTMLQLENGGVIVNRKFAAVERTDDYQGFGLSGSTGIDFGGFRKFIFGYTYGHASSDSRSDTVPAGGNDLLILSPQGPGGGLGGGVNVNGLFSDVTGLHFDDSYDEHLLYVGASFAPWRLPGTGASVTSYAKLLFGYVRETSDYSGTTAAGLLDFGYSSELETTRWGAAFGARLEQPISGPLGFYVDGELRFIENHTSASSTLNLSGGVNATEGAHASADKLDVGGIFGAGIYYITGNVTVRAGASYETWQTPMLKFSTTGPVDIDYGTRESIAATLTATVRFP